MTVSLANRNKETGGVCEAQVSHNEIIPISWLISGMCCTSPRNISQRPKWRYKN